MIEIVDTECRHLQWGWPKVNPSKYLSKALNWVYYSQFNRVWTVFDTEVMAVDNAAVQSIARYCYDYLSY